MTVKKPIVLAILDGWGYREAADDNAISCANAPTFQGLFSKYPYSLLEASEHFVGLPHQQMGNSEVGHMTIGSGRILMQELPRIDQAIAQNTLEQQPTFKHLVKTVQEKQGACHLIGLLSNGGVHSHYQHIIALTKLLLSRGIPVILHAFLDGRDTAPCCAESFITEVQAQVPDVVFGTVGGRFYGMDRDQRWERIEKAYKAMVEAEGPKMPDPKTVIKNAYDQNITDEFIDPTVIADYKGMQANDGVLMVNFRADRARQLAAALVDPDFKGFARSRTVQFSVAASLTEYTSDLAKFMSVVFEKEPTNQSLGEILADHGLKQLRIAETEKYAHVTFFFNGGREIPFVNESRVLIPSPKVATYDLQPEMSAFVLTEQLLKQLETVDVVIVNYANLDMVGHSGNQQAVQKAVEALDICLRQLIDAVIHLDGVLLLTADHGNAEQMWDNIHQSPHTAHTCNPVPFVGINLPQSFKLTQKGQLCDIAPTILQLLNITPPIVMTGTSLFK